MLTPRLRRNSIRYGDGRVSTGNLRVDNHHDKHKIQTNRIEMITVITA